MRVTTIAAVLVKSVLVKSVLVKWGLLQVFLLLAPPDACGRTLTVGGKGRYPTIQAAANAAESGDEIIISPGYYPENIRILRKDLTLRALPGPDARVVIDAAPEANPSNTGSGIRIVRSNVVLERLTIQGAEGVIGGGVVLFSGRVHLIACTVQDNFLGVVTVPAVPPGSLTLESCNIVRNGLGVQGRGSTVIHNSSVAYNRLGIVAWGIVEIVDTDVFSNGYPNAANEEAGAIAVSGFGRLERVFVKNNWSNGQSAGIFITDNGEFSVRKCVIENNESVDGAAGLALDGLNSADVSGCIIRNNKARGRVAAVAGLLVRRARAVVTDCRIMHNDGEESGGGISVQLNSSLTFKNGQVIGNVSMDRGGGMFVSQGRAHLEKVVLAGNRADVGGGISTEFNGEVQLNLTTLAANQANTGSALFLTSGPVTFQQSIVAFHEAPAFLCVQAPSFACSNVFSNANDSPCGVDGGGNLFLNPEFCNLNPHSGQFDLSLSTNSPLLDVSGCGQIGALPAQCTSTRVESKDWGGIKSLYR